MNNVIIWSKDACQYCDMAKKLLESKGIPFKEKKIGYGFTKEDLLKDVPTARAVPQIIVDGKPIGGFTELKNIIS